MPLRLQENGDFTGSTATRRVAARDYTVATISRLLTVGPGKIRNRGTGQDSKPWDRAGFELALVARGRVAPERSFTRRDTYTTGAMIQWSSLKKQKARAEILPRVFNAGT
jgi:hypothetical protein